MSGNDKVVLFLVLIGMLISFAGILAIVADKYKKAEREKAEDQAVDAEEIKQKILQMHDYGEFLNKELSNKQNEAMLMYEMLLEKEKKLAGEAAMLKSSAVSKGKIAFVGSSNKDSLPERREMANESPLRRASAERQSSSVREASLEDRPVQEQGELVNHNEEIKGLYRQGLSAGEIAERLQIGKGQAELVSRLFCS